ncbi:carbohydrate porin [Bdellovibrionota bacterium FG-2]
MANLKLLSSSCLLIISMHALTNASADATVETTTASDKLYALSLSYVSETSGALQGGLERKINLTGNLLIDARFDLGAITHLSGLSLYAQGIGIHGDSLSKSVGDVQVSSNIDAPKAARIYQAWLQKEFAGGAVSLLAGIHDLNSEFYSTEASRIFLNSSFGVGSDLSHTGANGPSIFPEPGMAIRAKIRPINDWEISTAMYDGNPGSSPWTSEDGGLGILELAHSQKINDRDGRYAIAAWGYSAQKQTRGAYFLANQKIYSPTSNDPRGLSAFVRTGLSDRGSVSSSWSSGVNYTGAIRTRDEDQMGFAITQAKGIGEEGEELARETVLEFTYLGKIKPWFSVQPDFQWILNPGMDSTAVPALVGAVRLQVVF